MTLGLNIQDNSFNKYNKPKAEGSYNKYKQDLRAATRTVSITAERSAHRGSIFNSNYINYQGLRASLNGGGHVMVNNLGRSKVDTRSNLFAEMMKQQQMLQSVQMFNQVLASAAETIKTIKSSGKDGAGGVDTNSNVENAYNGWSSGNIAENYNKALKDKSFNALNQVETNIDKTVKDFSNDYKKLGTDTKQAADEILQNESVNAGLKLVGATLDTSKLDLSEVKIDEDNLSSFDDASRNIDKDIEKINSFKIDIAKAKTPLTEKSNKLQENINGLISEINKINSELSTTTDPAQKTALETKKKELETKKAEAEKQKANVDKANKELDNMDKSTEKLTQDMETKKNELGDIKKIKGEIADKKYELAKELDKTAENAKNKLEKLGKEIDEKQKKGQDVSNKITEFNGLVKTAKNTVAELKAAGGQGVKFKNAKGKEYQIKMADYTVPEPKLQASSTPAAVPEATTPAAPAAPAAPAETPAPAPKTNILDNIIWTGDLRSCPSGKTVKIGDQTYIKDGDKFNLLSPTTPNVSYTLEQLEALKNEA